MPGLIGLQAELRGHAGHRVNLAAELRHEEAVHDADRGQPEMHRRADGNDELIDGWRRPRRVDEQPFPIERDDLDLERLACSTQRPEGSSACEPNQAMPPRNVITSAGIAQTISSSWPEKAQSGQ